MHAPTWSMITALNSRKHGRDGALAWVDIGMVVLTDCSGA